MDRLFGLRRAGRRLRPATRDLPAVAGTSVSLGRPAFRHAGSADDRNVVGVSTDGRAAFVRQLAWRDWYAHLLWEMPSLVDTALRPDLDRIDWENDPGDIEAWQEGRTGYPIVDAGMRQLATTGWMHNRVRMVVASFLVKDLLVDWRIGERWFRRLLVDGDMAQNAGNWQWVAGTGPDAAPYFRVFNPVLQSEKFDPDGQLHQAVRARAGPAARHRGSTRPGRLHPWSWPPLGVTLGDTYPHPIVDHGFARDRAIAAYTAAMQG